MPIIDVAATGANIKAMMRSKGFKVADVQARCGFNTPQAVFKWMRGDTVPTIDNMIIIADMFGVTIDQIVTPSDRRRSHSCIRALSLWTGESISEYRNHKIPG